MSEKLLVDIYYNDRFGCYLVLVSGASEVISEKRFTYIRYGCYLHMKAIFLALFNTTNFQNLSQDASFQTCILYKD